MWLISMTVAHLCMLLTPVGSSGKLATIERREPSGVVLHNLGDVETILAEMERRRVLCGPISLCIALQIRGHQVELSEILSRIEVGPDGVNIGDLVSVGRQFDQHTRAVRVWRGIPLSELNVPAILVLRDDHVAVLAGVSSDERQYLVVDGTHRVIQQYEHNVIYGLWTGDAITFQRYSITEHLTLLMGVMSGAVAVVMLSFPTFRTSE